VSRPKGLSFSRIILPRLAALLAALALPALLALPAAAAERRPNFVVILADDLGYGDLGVYGHPKIRTPRIDAMAGEGVRLTEFYSMPVCTPARAALLTGRYPLRSGLTRVLLPKEKWGLPAQEITLGEALAPLGYRSALVGKWHLGGRPPYRPLRHGFDEFFGVLFSNDMTLLPLVKWPRFALFENRKQIESPTKVNQVTRRYTERAVRFIEENREEPFFLLLSHTMPHVPLAPSKAFRGQSDFGLYGDVVEEIDWSTGEVLDAIDRNGLAEDTLVIFTSDNGPHLEGGDGNRVTRGSAGGLRGAKDTTWEAGVRTPFIARWPGKLPSGEVRGGMASILDLFPAFIETAGGEPPDDRVIDGKNILPFLRGESGSPHTEIYHFFRGQVYAIRSGSWKLHLRKRPVGPGGKPDKPVPAFELYDLANDPEESEDLSERYPQLARRLLHMAIRFETGIEPRMELPSQWRSVAAGLVTLGPKNARKLPGK